jgi:MFS family permease
MVSLTCCALYSSFAYVTAVGGKNVSSYMAIYGIFWALGLLLGPIVGGAIADNQHATWRWVSIIGRARKVN